jgi:hypothetical protein
MLESGRFSMGRLPSTPAGGGTAKINSKKQLQSGLMKWEKDVQGAPQEKSPPKKGDRIGGALD